MDILPAWMIEEIRKFEELQRTQRENRLYIDPLPAWRKKDETKEEESVENIIPLR